MDPESKETSMKYYLGYFAVVMFLVGLGIGAVVLFMALAAKFGFCAAIVAMIIIGYVFANYG